MNNSSPGQVPITKGIKYPDIDNCLAGQSESTADRGGDV